MKTDIISFTEKGFLLGKKISQMLGEKGHEVKHVLGGSFFPHGESLEKVKLNEWCERGFKSSRALIYIGAVGIAVRSIAPHIQSKINDPAVIVADDTGKYVIPLLSGHVGGANKLAIEIAGYIGALPVITTATDNNRVFAVDTWAKEEGMAIINPEGIKNVSSKLLRGERVKLRSDFQVEGELPEGVELWDSGEYHIYITFKNVPNSAEEKMDKALILVPPSLAVGMGARKGIDYPVLEEHFLKALEENNISKRAVKTIASIDLKAEEAALIELCESYGYEYITFSADELNEVQGDFKCSDFVKATTGTDNVCERSAVKAGGGELIAGRKAENGITSAIAKNRYKVDFRGYRGK